MEDYCRLSGTCGGCFYTKESVEEELEKKRALVQKLLTEAYGEPFPFEGILQSPLTKGYRNKMEYSFGDDRKDGPLTLGFHQRKSFFNVVNCTECALVHEDFNQIVKVTVEYFRELGLTYVNKKSHIGYLRYLIVRRAVNTGELLVDLVTSSQELKKKAAPGEEPVTYKEEEVLSGFTDRILSLEKEEKLEGTLKGILHTVNDTLSDAVRDDGTTVLYGEAFINEELLGLKFKISPFSFFQTNSKSAELLYGKAREYITSYIRPDATVYDLYTGTGTIAQMIAPSAKKVVGVEIVPEAVEAARENAERNGLTNCEFIAGDVLNELDTIKEKPDVIILDPPRDGVNPKALKKIIDFGVDTILYISCKPESLARDLLPLKFSGYRLVKAVAVNQFPRTKHVETVCLLSNRKADAKIRIDVDLEDYYAIKDAKKSQN